MVRRVLPGTDSRRCKEGLLQALRSEVCSLGAEGNTGQAQSSSGGGSSEGQKGVGKGKGAAKGGSAW